MIIPPPEEVLLVRRLLQDGIDEFERMANNDIPYSRNFEAFEELYTQMSKMPTEFTDEAIRGIDLWNDARENALSDSYFNMRPVDRQAELERRIQEDENARYLRRKQWLEKKESNEQESNDQLESFKERTAINFQEQLRRRLERTTPEERAKYVEYRRALEECRKQMDSVAGKLEDKKDSK